jgi:glycosyltransferase involved in cell wall biosynthesis
VWHTRAHGLALRARAGGGALIRAHSSGREPRLGERWLFSGGCDALVCTSEACAASHRSAGRARGVVHGVAGAVDLARFRPVRDEREIERGRALLGVPVDAPLIGVVARVQAQRRFDLLIEAMVPLCASEPRRRLVVLGRGTHLDRVARQPAALRGLAQQIVFAGHLDGERYPAALRALDVLCFLVPGSDGGCRAVLEAAASGVPAVVSQRRGLAEWVVDGETGLVVGEQPVELAAALARLLDARAERSRMAAAARARAESLFSPARLGAELERIYSAACG